MLAVMAVIAVIGGFDAARSGSWDLVGIAFLRTR
jgi:hypothetical protein